ncbi:hypothetical protein, partial [Corynebacterium glyciniphilum]|uniref:hypothetical protein n=1 Tax=Corynebacterium glyciniphilum TaxID=1404244 RepID=UPI00164362A5
VGGGGSEGIWGKVGEGEGKGVKWMVEGVVREEGGRMMGRGGEGVREEKMGEDVDRVHRRWLEIMEKEKREGAKKGARRVTM